MRSVWASEILITETSGDPRQPQISKNNHDANDDTSYCNMFYYIYLYFSMMFKSMFL